MALEQTDYLRAALECNLRKKSMETISKELKRREIQFDAIVARGASGLLIGPSLADKMKKPFILARKRHEKEGSHSSHRIEYSFESQKTISSYIIVDDLISTGETIREIVQTMREDSFSKAELACICLYYSLASNKETHILDGEPPVPLVCCYNGELR